MAATPSPTGRRYGTLLVADESTAEALTHIGYVALVLDRAPGVDPTDEQLDAISAEHADDVYVVAETEHQRGWALALAERLSGRSGCFAQPVAVRNGQRAAEYLGDGHELEDLEVIYAPSDRLRTADSAWRAELGNDYAAGTPTDISGHILGEVHDSYRRWFGESYDIAALDAVLCAAAGEHLDGDPAWLLVVGGSGATKTETVAPLQGAGAHVVSTLTGPAALLSGTSKKERAADAHGGLLRKIGTRGTLVLKDFTSILTMHRDTRAEVLGALREIYDGTWHREVGTEGGRTLAWSGRLVLIGAVTTAWDSAHAVIATMGDRFVLVRMRSRENRRRAGEQALDNVRHEHQMREELSEAVGHLLDNVPAGAPIDLTEDTKNAILDVADLVTLGRTAVERSYDGSPMWAHDPEMPTRFAKQLAQITRGGIALGMREEDALAVAIRCASDTMPRVRLRLLCDVAGHDWSTTTEVTKRVQLPRKTVDRALQELHLLELLVARGVGPDQRGHGRGPAALSHLRPDDFAGLYVPGRPGRADPEPARH